MLLAEVGRSCACRSEGVAADDERCHDKGERESASHFDPSYRFRASCGTGLTTRRDVDALTPHGAVKAGEERFDDPCLLLQRVQGCGAALLVVGPVEPVDERLGGALVGVDGEIPASAWRLTAGPPACISWSCIRRPPSVAAGGPLRRCRPTQLLSAWMMPKGRPPCSAPGPSREPLTYPLQRVSRATTAAFCTSRSVFAPGWRRTRRTRG
jgi:hypothetical protein